jgi:hypothetical protein
VASPDPDLADLDARLAAWRQGDCVLGAHWFLFRADPTRPLTAASQGSCDDVTGNTEAEVPGFVVLTQTCDLVRRCAERPFVELAALASLSPDDWRQAERGRLPRYALVPGVAEQRLAADLDRVMSVEKAIVAGWDRAAGCRTDDEARAFALALSRKRARAAFPDDFVALVSPLQRRIIEKHDKASAEGRALQALREVRVRAAPSWDAPAVELTFFFIREDDAPDFEGRSWADHLRAWLGLVKANARFQPVDGLVLTLDDLTARDYVESDLLDLGYLSGRPA